MGDCEAFLSYAYQPIFSINLYYEFINIESAFIYRVILYLNKIKGYFNFKWFIL